MTSPSPQTCYVTRLLCFSLDKYLNNLPGKKTNPPSNRPTTETPANRNENTTTTLSDSRQDNNSYGTIRSELVYPMQKMGLNNNETSNISQSRVRGPGQDAFETSLRSSPAYSKPGATNTKIPPPPPAKKPPHLSPTGNKVSVPNPLYSQTFCGHCNKPVSTGVMVTALNKKWHAGCFACSTCGEPLDKVEFFEKDGKPYCTTDYRKLFNARCDYCKQPVEEVRYRSWHNLELTVGLVCRRRSRPLGNTIILATFFVILAKSPSMKKVRS